MRFVRSIVRDSAFWLAPVVCLYAVGGGCQGRQAVEICASKYDRVPLTARASDRYNSGSRRKTKIVKKLSIWPLLARVKLICAGLENADKWAKIRA